MKTGTRGADGKLKNGPYKEFFKGGSVSCEGRHKDGERTGEWKFSKIGTATYLLRRPFYS